MKVESLIIVAVVLALIAAGSVPQPVCPKLAPSRSDRALFRIFYLLIAFGTFMPWILGVLTLLVFVAREWW